MLVMPCDDVISGHSDDGDHAQSQLFQMSPDIVHYMLGLAGTDHSQVHAHVTQ